MTKLQRMAVAGGFMGGVATFVLGLVAHAQAVPTLGTSDVAAATNPIWQAIKDLVLYILQTYGPLMVGFLGILVVLGIAWGIYNHFR